MGRNLRRVWDTEVRLFMDSNDIIYNLYDTFLKSGKRKWVFANDVLYKMCEDYPEHDDIEIVLGKLLVIGRTYAAAIERRRIQSGENREENDLFYYNIVGKAMAEISEELDERIKSLRSAQCLIKDKIDDILVLHKMLVDKWKQITHLEKRSLASKYLHFHCADMFFIFDERASSSVRKLIKKSNLVCIDQIKDIKYDEEYGAFVCKMIEIQQIIENRSGERPSPRTLDDFLLWLSENDTMVTTVLSSQTFQ